MAGTAASIAAAISLLRVLVIVFALSPRLLPLILLTTSLVFVCGSLFLVKGAPGEGQDVEARNPLELMPLLVFAGLFSVTAALGAAAVTRIGNNSLDWHFGGNLASSTSTWPYSRRCAPLAERCRSTLLAPPSSQPRLSMPGVGCSSRSSPVPPDTGCRSGSSRVLPQVLIS